MIRFITMLVMIFISSLAYCQRMAVIENDTVAILTIPQVKQINSALVDLKFKSEMVIELTKQVDIYKLSVNSLENQNSMLCATEQELNKKIASYESMYQISEDARKSTEKSLKRYKIFGFTVAIVGITALLLK